jgi:hypothetical protein
VRSFAVRKAYGGDILVGWPEWKDVDLDTVVREMVERYIAVSGIAGGSATSEGGIGVGNENATDTGKAESERMKWFKKVREEGEWMSICGLLLRSLKGVERMEFDGWSLVDPRAKGWR